MSKKVKKCFNKNLTFEKLFLAHKRARNHKVYKPEVIKFEMDLESNLSLLLSNIKNNKYRIGKYREFKVYEPKERVIKSLPYVDRIVHQWYVEEFIKPYIVPKFIDTSYACIIDKGTHKAVDKIQKYMRIFKIKYGDFWILKCDIKKFFYSIDPYILFEILSRYISDKKLLSFTKLLIFNSRDEMDKVGIPIGNYTSQFFANIYLNELDYYIKHKLKRKYYVRYMDDFIILAKTKEHCIIIKNKVEKFIKQYLHLELNSKSRYYPYKLGVNFCGYRIFVTHRLLRTNSKSKIKRKIKDWNKLYNIKKLDLKNAMQSLNSWLGHSSHCNSYKLQNKMFNSCDFLYTDSVVEKLHDELISDMNNWEGSICTK